MASFDDVVPGAVPGGVVSLAEVAPRDETEQAIYAEIAAADGDGDGRVTRDELYGAIQRTRTSAGLEGIPISHFDPDRGHGEGEPWEREVYERIRRADTDDTRHIS